MRWIPPGRFTMGSPVTETGRDDDEVQHEVTLSQGFYLADTQCTQALWQAVMEDNPSYFKSLDRPVERVSWDDVQAFIGRLNERVPGLDVRLPTEAEWEYACRAGTTTSTYVGDAKLLGDCNAPALHPIAWYAGNSGCAFELDNGVDSSDWPQKQFNHSRAGTHPVATRMVNPWGLYDMLGNIWEWCGDWFGAYPESAVTDPSGPDEGSSRVVRGGSWDYFARLVRAALRGRYNPEDGDYYLGFRLARGQAE